MRKVNRPESLRLVRAVTGGVAASRAGILGPVTGVGGGAEGGWAFKRCLRSVEDSFRLVAEVGLTGGVDGGASAG